MQTVIVAGGAGFIGSHVCEELLARSYRVLCVDNFLTSDRSNIEGFISHPHFTLVEHDLTTPLPQTLQREDISYIFHLASPASPNKHSKKSYIQFPIETMLVNSIGTYYLLELARKKEARLLFASTSEVYGDPEVSPQKETYFGNVNSVGVRAVYDEGKRFGEAMVMGFVRKHDVDGRIVRIFNTFGPRMQVDDGRVVSNFITQALQGKALTIYGDGSQTRSFCYVDDLVQGLLTFMFAEDAKGEVINMGNPDERTIKELAQLIKEKTGSSSQLTYEALPQDDPKLRCPDITKAKTLLHWEPHVTIEDGLDRAITYFKKVV